MLLSWFLDCGYSWREQCQYDVPSGVRVCDAQLWPNDRAALVDPQEQPRRGLWAAKKQTFMHELILDANVSGG